MTTIHATAMTQEKTALPTDPRTAGLRRCHQGWPRPALSWSPATAPFYPGWPRDADHLSRSGALRGPRDRPTGDPYRCGLTLSSRPMTAP